MSVPAQPEPQLSANARKFLAENTMPLRPSCWPFSTLSPTFTPIDDRWPYSD